MKKIKTISPRLEPRTVEWLDTTFKNPTSGAAYCIDTFRTLYVRALYDLRGRFTHGGLALILDVFNGSVLTPALAGQHLAVNCIDGMKLDSLDEKWGVNRSEFTAKLNNLTSTESAALEIWAHGYWYAHNELPDFENYISGLDNPE